LDKEKIINSINIWEKFLEKYLENGFGTMTKKEVDLYIFYLLYETKLKSKSIYEISKELKISEQRVKNLMKEVYLKYKTIDNKEVLKRIAKAFLDSKIDIERKDDKVRFLLEDPILKLEFEHKVKELGAIIDYSFNKDVLVVKKSVFVSIFFSEALKNERYLVELKSKIKNKELFEMIESSKDNKNLLNNIEKFFKDNRENIKDTIDIIIKITSLFLN